MKPTRDGASEEILLSNGIPVLFQNYDAPVAAFYWWIKTGSVDERPKEAGFAHFLEHMHFKDTDAKNSGKASTGEMANAIESLGGDVNAYTSFDHTVYHVTCAAHHWERVTDTFAEMARPMKFLKKDFELEREVILEELKKNEDSPSRRLFQNLFSATFAKHPYGRPVIGFVKTLKAAKVADLEAFYRRQYVSGNMGLVMVGPYTEARKKALIKILEKRFGQKVLKKKAAVNLKREPEPVFRPRANLVAAPFDVKTPSVCISFRVPELLHPDVPVLDLASSVLGMGELGRLYQKLFYGTSIVTQTGGGLYVPNDPGMVYFTLETTDSKKVPEAFSQMLDELNRISTEGPSEEEIARVIVNAESEKLYATQSADGVASRLGFLRFQIGDMTYDDRYLAALKAVTPELMATTMKKYLDPKRMAFTIMFPKTEAKFDLAPIQKLIDKKLGSAAPAVKGKAPAVLKGKTRDLGEVLPELITLPSGARILYRERPTSHVMSIHASALGGLRLEQADPVKTPELDQGASTLLAMTWTKGTPTHDSRAIMSLTEGSAASLDGFAGRNTIGLQTVGLARDWTKLSDLFTDVLLHPQFPAEELEHCKRLAEDSIRGIEDHSSSLCSKLFLETLYEKHPYGRHLTGTLESVASIDPDRLRAFHRKWIAPERLVLSVSGQVPRRNLDRWLHELDAQLQSLRLPSRERALVIPEEPALAGPRWVDRNLDREQVHILVGGLGMRLGSEDRYPMRILQNVLGGQSGRLFIELREKKSLAYSVAPVAMEGIEPGYCGTYIACSPSKKNEAILGIEEVLGQLAAKGPSPKEMKRAKEYYLGKRAMDLQGDSSIASYYGLETVYGLPLRTEKEILKQVEAVTAKQVQEVCRRYLVDLNRVTATVG